MKKIGLLFVCLFFGTVAFAQQYQMKVKFRVMYNANNVRCDSRVKLTFYMDDGQTWEWFQQFNLGEDDWGEWEKSFSFPISQRVTRINCESHRYTESATSCTHRDGGDTDVYIALSEYPCASKTWTGVFIGYDAASSLQVDIAPLSNAYAFQTEAKLKINKSMTFLQYTATLVFQDNSREVVSEGSTENLPNPGEFNFREMKPAAAKNKRVKSVEVRTYWEFLFFQIIDETRTFDVTDPTPEGNFDVTLADPFFELGSGSSLRVQYGRPRTPLSYSPNVSATLPSDNDVTITVAEPYSNQYRWQFKVEGESYQNMPSSFGTNNNIVVSGKKLFDAMGIDVSTKLFKNISFKAVYICSPTYETAEIILRHLPSAPGIVSVEPEMESCNGFNDGKFKINFSRALFPNELLYVFINGEAFDTDHYAYAADNSVIITNRSPGDYNFSLITTFGALGNGYADGPNHFASKRLDARPAITGFTAVKSDVHCYEGMDGLVTVAAQGGTFNYTAFLDQAGQPTKTISLSSSASNVFTDLKKGMYTVTLKDSKNCDPKIAGNIVIHNREIAQPANGVALLTLANVEPLGFGLEDGHITVQVSQGTAPYTFTWTDQANNTRTADPAQTVGSTMTSTLNNIGKGDYHVIARDNQYALAFPQNEVNLHGCYDTLTIEMSEPPLLEVYVEQHRYVSCYGYKDGELVAHAKGGRPYLQGETYEPYHYEWHVITSGSLVAFGTSDSIVTERPSATYRIKVTDRNGISKWSADFPLVQPNQLTIDFNTSELLCNGDKNGTSQAIVAGGTIPYRYAWSTDAITPDVTGLTDGWYSVVVTDTRGCTTFAQTEVVVPNSLSVNADITLPICQGDHNGSIALHVAGGAQPYQYVWKDGVTSDLATNLGQGEYSVRITDANHCFIEDEYVLQDPSLFAVSLGPDRVLCKDQTLPVDVSIDDPSAVYMWSRDGVSFTTVSNPELSIAGTYQVVITDSNGCFNSDNVKITRDETVIAANIVVATRVPLDGKVRVANISHPAPDRISWIIPDQAYVMEKNDGYLDLSFSTKGEYTVGLTSFKASCEQTVFSTIKVVDKSELTDYNMPDEPYIKQFNVAPNPNNGKFSVTVELKEAGTFTLILYNLQGIKVSEQIISGQSFSRTDFDVSSLAASGTYVLRLLTSSGYSTHNIIIQ